MDIYKLQRFWCFDGFRAPKMLTNQNKLNEKAN